MLRFLLAAFLALASASVGAANHYIRDGATGTGSCADWTTANACDALPSTLVRGDIYYIADGAYSGRTFGTATSGSTLITIKKATIADHGTDTGWLDTYGDGQAAFSGQFDFTTSYWVIDGQTGGGPDAWNSGFGFKITETGDSSAILRVAYTGTANNITVRHVDLQGKGSAATQGGSFSNDGLAVYNASGVTLSYFWMHGIGRCPFFLSAQNIIIEYGWVESFFGSGDVHSEVASIWAFDGSVGDTTFRYNLFTDMQSTGGIMWDATSNSSANLDIYGNVFYKPSGATWQEANGVIGGWTGYPFTNVSVYNNTFINVDQQSLSTFPSCSGNVASNNVWYNGDSPNFGCFATHNYNHFINAGGTHSEANGTSAASGDPFVDYVNRDFRLKAATSAAGTLAAPYNVDPTGITRGTDGVWDRGAYEYDEAGALLPAPTNLRWIPL